MPPVIEARGLTRRFGELLAVEDVDFAVEAGELFGFLGPNGAGKTTTVRMLTGVIEPTDGSAVVNGHDVVCRPTLARQGLGIVPEEANVYLDLSVWRNVMLMAELHGVPRTERKRQGRRWLEELGLGDRRTQKARALSKGLRQRLMLCTALVSDPDVLFLDEPTSGLDVRSARLIRRKVRELNAEGTSIFLTTHNMQEAEEMCSRVAIIDHGRIAAIDTPEQLRGAMQSSQYVEVSFGAGAAPEGLEDLPGVLRHEERNGLHRLLTENPGELAMAVARLAESAGGRLEELRTCKPSLEEVFVHITGEEGHRAEG